MNAGVKRQHHCQNQAEPEKLFFFIKFITKSNLYNVKDLDLIRLKKIGNKLQELRLQKNLTKKNWLF
jgi:hypothetical protein